MNRSVIVLCVLVAMVAALTLAAPAGKTPKVEWTKAPGSPTARRTITDSAGQQIHHSTDTNTGHRTTGFLAKGDNARASSPTQRIGQPSTGGKPSTSKKGKGK
ncbi:uncharacterized protein LOC113212226 [Frankliniella occidentalis]|uniref:Uncharacterized protein LOC113212226 n=1 Tax=Frankliniella occidentalis TaxID=133901 RepID=A0A6J1T093_FRAOC|nr:uncharacterized protein LOC113212226 [Frankliniella occidentalis]